MLLLQTNDANNNDFWTLLLGVASFLVTLGTLVATAYFYSKSTKAAERAADSSEKSANFAEQSTKSAAKSVEIAEQAAQISAQTLEVQRIHNVKSVRPILSIFPLCHDEEVSVSLKNNGMGTLIIKDITVTDGVTSNHDLISWMPLHPRGITYWETYKRGYYNLAISPQQSEYLVSLKNADEDFPDYVLFRAYVRRNLSRLTISVRYEDIYDNPIETQTRDLSWFGSFTGWYQRQFPEEFVNFNPSLDSAKRVCSTVEEWDRKLEIVKQAIAQKTSSINKEQSSFITVD